MRMLILTVILVSVVCSTEAQSWQGSNTVLNSNKDREDAMTMNQDIRSSIRWRIETGHALLVAPAVTAELVVAVGLEQSSLDRAGYLDAWERDTGRLRWSFSGSAGMGLKGGILGTPAVAGDLLCFVGGQGTFLCLDLHSGSTQWEAQAGGPVVTAPAIANDQVFFTSEDGSLTALDLMTGQQRWTFQTGDAVRAAPVVDDGRVIIGSWDGNLYAVSIKGTLLCKADLSPARPTAVAVEPGRVVFFDTLTGDVRSVAVRQDAGVWRIEEMWRLPTGRQSRIQPVLVRHMICLVGRGDDHVICVDAATGEPQWTAATGNSPLTPMVEDEQLIVTSRDGRISAFELRTGTETWRVETGILFSSDASLYEGTLYAGGRDGAMYAFVLK